MDTLLSMKVFRQVVESGSFVGAADRLDLSTAMVSKHVAHLESHLGTRLLNRTTRKLSLTESGQAYFERCTQALNDLEEAERAIGEANVTPRGTLRITSLVTVGVRYLVPMISAYTAKFPQVTIDLTLNDRLADIVEEGYDLAIRASIGELRASSLVARPIAKSHFVVCASPGYLKRNGRPKTPQDLANHNCLVFGLAPNPWVLGHGAEQQRVVVSGKFISNNGDALCRAAISGSGIALLPTDIAGEALRSGELVPLFAHLKQAEIGIYAVYPSRRHLSAKVRTFVDFLAQQFAVQPFW
jgi:DNA-binding transcriptional LysR family regulator